MKQRHDHTLQIKAENQPTVLERLLQVTRYRGFSITAFRVLPTMTGNMLDITLTVHEAGEFSDNPENNMTKLCHQLNKLFDIKHVNLKSMKVGNMECKSSKFSHSPSNCSKYVSQEMNNLISNVN